MGKYFILDYCPNLVYRIILFSVHNIILLLNHLRSLWRNAGKWYVAGLGQFKGSQSYWMDMKTLRHTAKGFTKSPKHITIILTNKDDICTERISDVVIWGVFFGTSYVTIYDKRGQLSSIQDKIKHKILKKLGMILGNEITKYSLVFKDSSSSYDNGYVNTTGICVQVISEDDCRKDIVDATHQVAEQNYSNLFENADIDSSLVDSKLKAIKGLPDPDLAIQFGKIQFLDGCLPWQMRLTEIFSFESCRSFQFDDFLIVLKRFSKCEQRLGK